MLTSYSIVDTHEDNEFWSERKTAVALNYHPHDRKGGGLVVCPINSRLNDSNSMCFRNCFSPRSFNGLGWFGIPMPQSDVALKSSVVTQAMAYTRCLFSASPSRQFFFIAQTSPTNFVATECGLTLHLL